ncbi:MAG: aminotransferase class V-fold PLP-dependent enzyme [Gemmatimonadota bacterium]|nr:aminotransferase class V-fold PLP-dependent enzyme [Gemmatimonadota bacterium]
MAEPTIPADLAGALARWRADTPGIAHRNHLNNAGAALMPTAVHQVILEHLQLEMETGGYEAADGRSEAIADGYGHLGRLVGAAPGNIAVTANATDAFARAISSFDFVRRDVIVTTRCDYTSNQLVYLALHQRLGLEIVHAPDLPEGGVDPDGVRHAILEAGGRCRLVAATWIPTNSGLVQDVAAVGQVCRELEVPYLVDACQAVGQIPIDVEQLQCDYLSATARKFLRGPRGVGFLYVSDRALARGDYPLLVDMRGANWVAEDQFALVESAQRFEDWEFPYALVLGQGEAARYALEVGIETASARAWQLAARLRERCGQLDGVRVLDRGATRCAIVTISPDMGTAQDLVAFLKAQQINCVASLREYGRYDFGEKGVDGAVRLSPHYYNTEAEVDAAALAVAEFVCSRR